MNILRIAMNGEEYPHYTMSEAFKNSFTSVKTIWWQQEINYNQAIINEVTQNKYDAVFLQIQTPNVISEEAAKAINDHSIGFNWTGDVRTNIDWYIRLGKYFVTCFTNETDVERMKSLGLRSEYLQVGYDHKYYFPANAECYNNIVFCANYYQDDQNPYPLTDYRKELVYALKRNFGERFNLYGGNWNMCGIYPELAFVNNEQEAQIYRTCGIAINCSHFNYSRYSSDRLFRELACGAFVLSHDYKDYDKDFENGKHLVTWSSIDDLVEKCHYYLQRPIERRIIGEEGYSIVKSTATWNSRMIELKQIINKYK